MAAQNAYFNSHGYCRNSFDSIFVAFFYSPEIQIAGGVVSIIGAVFLLLGAVGILRMPDSYNRIQAGTKATTLGTILFLLGIGIVHLTWLPKLAILILFILFTNPVSSHVLARAAHLIGVPLTKLTVIDKLKKQEVEK